MAVPNLPLKARPSLGEAGAFDAIDDASYSAPECSRQATLLVSDNNRALPANQHAGDASSNAASPEPYLLQIAWIGMLVRLRSTALDRDTRSRCRFFKLSSQHAVRSSTAERPAAVAAAISLIRPRSGAGLAATRRSQCASQCFAFEPGVEIDLQSRRIAVRN